MKRLAPPVLALAAACLAASMYPDDFTASFVYALPIALLAVAAAAAVFGYGRGSVLSALRAQRSVNRRLAELQAQYAVAEGLAVMGSWVYDLPGGSLHWSEGSYRVFGMPKEQGPPSARAFHRSIHPDDQERWRKVHRRGVKDGTEVRLDYRFIKADGDQVWIRSVAQPESNTAGTVVRLAGITQDITAMRAMAQQLAASEAKFRDLTLLSSDWVWETDAGQRLSFVSDSVVCALGAWARDHVGKRFWETDLIGLPLANWESLKADLESERVFENFQYSLLDPYGHLYSVAISGHPRLDANGATVGFSGVGRNVTRETQQQLLLQLESEMATVMREHCEPERVVEAIIIAVSRVMSWSGGAHLAQIPGTTSLTVRERWGLPPIARMLDGLPRQIPIAPDSVEAKAWKGQAIWMHDLTLDPTFASRYQADATGTRAAFLAPISDEQKHVLSTLMFFSPVGFRADTFLSQVADTLSRTLSLYLQRKAAEKRLVHASRHDALTGLPNRVHLTEQLQQRLAAKEPASILYVDLDRYKVINDTLGHQAGDQVLIEVARRFRESIGPRDIAGRIGGDEFILLLDGEDDRARIEAIARRVLAAIERPFILQNRPCFLSASIGVAVSPENGSDSSLLIRCADSEMYQVKSEGRNDVRFFTQDKPDGRGDQLQLASELRGALQRGDVDLYYQPVLAVGNRHIVGMEGLIRWRHPQRGLLLPDAFLPTAEQNDLMHEVGMWTIRRALDDRIELGIEDDDEMSVSVNVSPRQLEEDGFLARLTGLLAERDFPPRLLRLELTENALIDNSSETVALLGDLKRLGVQVIIDNFGTGYASLSYLRNLPVAGLKIDHTFVRDLQGDRGNAAIVQAIMTLAGKLGLQVVAEGVESAAEMRALRSFHCDHVQGSFICEPLPLAQLKEFLSKVPKLRRKDPLRLRQTAGGDAAAHEA